MSIKKIDIKEFREGGYLQELNRRFLHPLGLALSISIDEETGEEKLDTIWDYREDEEGIMYDLKNSDEERISRFSENSKKIQKELNKKLSYRFEKFGYGIEPID